MKHRHLLVALVALIALVSCTHEGPDYYIYESYQIANTSSENKTLSFSSQGTPKYVYAQIFDQSDLVRVTQDNAIKSREELLHVTSLSLKPGQSALFYELISTYEHTHVDDSIPPTATSLHQCGYGSSFYNLFRMAINLMGDSIHISSEGQTDTIVPMTNKSIWQTWYDGKQFIYYHVWSIEKL